MFIVKELVLEVFVFELLIDKYLVGVVEIEFV